MVSSARILAFLLLVVSLSGPGVCHAAGEPDAPRIRAVLQERLDAMFEDRLFRVRGTERLATRSHREPADDREWLLVRYRAELRFQRDHRLASWDSLNVGALVPLLGSSARHVRGVNALGNERGDVLAVEGTLSFVLADGAWTPAYSAARIQPETVGAAAVGEQPLNLRLRAQLEHISEALEEGEADEGGLALEGDLEQLVADVECRMADGEGLLRLGTAAPTTEYMALGRGLAEVMNADDERLYVRGTTGSVDNIELLHAGMIDAAFVQDDVAYLAHRGQGMFQGKLPMQDLRAVCALFPEVVHVVTLQGAGIVTVADLAGATVDVGPDDSGTRVNANQVLTLSGLSYADLGGVQGSPPGQALDDLVEGRIQAAIMTGALPYPAIAARAWSLPLVVVPIGEDAIAAAGELPYLVPTAIPVNTYPGQTEPIPTLGVSAVLVVREDLPDEEVAALLGALFDGREQLGQHTVQAWYLSVDTADRGLSIPFHPAAERFLAAASAR